jgi:hypothetical protein
MSTSYIIQFINQGTPTQFCLGASSAASNAPVVLSLLAGAGSPTTQWNLDPNSGLIQLASTAGSPLPLYLTIPGTSIVQGAQLLIAPFLLGSQMQSWNWVGSAPRIVSNAPPATFCVDNNNCTMSAGNKVMIYPNSGVCQTWQFIAVPVMAHALEAAAKSAEKKGPTLHA